MLQPASILETVQKGFQQFSNALSSNALRVNPKGQSLIETSLVMGLVGVVCIGTVATLGGNISTLMADASSAGSPSTALVSNTQLVNTNLGAPNPTSAGASGGGGNPTPGGALIGDAPTTGIIPSTGGSGTLVPVTSVGSTVDQTLPPIATIDNTTAGGPIGPVANPVGTTAGSTKKTPNQSTQFSPEYQAWRNNPNNAKTVAMIDSLSPDGQKIANTILNPVAGGGFCPDCLFREFEQKSNNPDDLKIYRAFVSNVSTSGVVVE